MKAAAGIAGVIKVILSLQHQSLPPHLHFTRPSGHIDWHDNRLSVTDSARPWPRSERRRVAGISSFGFSGTNAHVVLQDPPPARAAPVEPRTFRCLPLSARSHTALVALAARYARALAADPGVSIADVGYTAGAGRSHFAHRLAVVTGSTGGAIDALTAFAEDRHASRVAHWNGRPRASS